MSTILVTHKGPTCYITLNRPEALNALNKTLFTELEEAVDAFVADPNLKGAIITGSGSKAFAAGADITEFQSLNEQSGEALSARGQAIFAKIENSPKPIIAAVNGYALGGGCELAMACHIRIASEKALFGQPEVKLGLLPGYGATQRLVRYLGRARATELLITADMIDSQKAHEYGLVNQVTMPENLMEVCETLLAKAYKQSPNAIALTLQAIAAGQNDTAGYEMEAALFGKALVSEEAKEGINAFLEKRKPNF